jgi:uncharacterized membrane protein YjdF
MSRTIDTMMRSATQASLKSADVTLAFSALFEIVEGWIARLTNPQLGAAYLGMQGDEWDAQKDMTAALIGGILCMTATAILRRYFRKGQTVRSKASAPRKI